MADDVEDIVQPLTKYKEDVDAFSAPAEGYGVDYISGMPSEILNEILSYLIRDHDPERAIKKHAKESQYKVYDERPHILLSLSAMSRHFKNHVEAFALLHMKAHKDTYRFKTIDEIEELNSARRVRRSERLKGKSITVARCYRFELVNHLQHWCIGCHCYETRRANMANAVSYCWKCEREELPEQIVSDVCSRLRAL